MQEAVASAGTATQPFYQDPKEPLSLILFLEDECGPGACKNLAWVEAFNGVSDFFVEVEFWIRANAEIYYISLQGFLRLLSRTITLGMESFIRYYTFTTKAFLVYYGFKAPVTEEIRRGGLSAIPLSDYTSICLPSCIQLTKLVQVASKVIRSTVSTRQKILQGSQLWYCLPVGMKTLEMRPLTTILAGSPLPCPY